MSAQGSIGCAAPVARSGPWVDASINGRTGHVSIIVGRGVKRTFDRTFYCLVPLGLRTPGDNLPWVFPLSFCSSCSPMHGDWLIGGTIYASGSILFWRISMMVTRRSPWRVVATVVVCPVQTITVQKQQSTVFSVILSGRFQWVQTTMAGQRPRSNRQPLPSSALTLLMTTWCSPP